ncbi:MAG: hypothetical protein ACX94C_05135 [Phycisphaerales bacterium]
MRNRFLSTALISILSVNAGLAEAQENTAPQPDAEADQPVEQDLPAPEPQLFEFETAGFSFNLEVPYEPVIRESTNASIYAVTVQRRAGDGLALGTDGRMAFVRLTQTIDTIETTGTIEQFLGATVSDAFRSIENAYGELSRQVTTDCSLEILGKQRQGKRIDVGMLPNGTHAYVECYAFELEDGTGVGVTLKIHDPVGDEIPNDLRLTDELLLSLDVSLLEPETPYFQSFNGYPIHIPVRSSIREAKRVNPFVTSGTVACEYGSLRLQVIELQADANASDAADFQIQSFSQAITQQQDRGEIEVLWSGEMDLPAGDDGNSVLAGRAFLIRMGEQEFFSTMHAAVDDGKVLIANVSGASGYRDQLIGYAATFFDRPLASAKTPRGTDRVSGYTITMPQGLHTLVGRDSHSLSELILTTSSEMEWADARIAITEKHAAYTHVALNMDETQSLEQMQAQVLLGLFGEEATNAAQHGSSSADTQNQPRHLSAKVSADLHVKSYAVDVEGQTILVSTVAPPRLMPAHDRVTRLLIGRIHQDSSSGQIELPFGTLTYNPEQALISRTNPSGVRDSFRVQSGTGALEILIQPLGEDADESPYLRHLRPAWGAHAAQSSDKGFPANIEELDQVHVAGQHARQIDITSGEEAFTRIIGFEHGDTFVTLVASGQDQAEADNLLSMIKGE